MIKKHIRSHNSNCVNKVLLTILFCIFNFSGIYSNSLFAIKTTVNQEDNKITKFIKGTVKDQDGEPIPGVAIMYTNHSIGTVTDIDGNFSIMALPDGTMLNFTFIGLKSVSVKVKYGKDLHIKMEPLSQELEEVVVTGMDIIKKSHMTGSASVITSRDMKTQGITSIDKVLEGTIAGLNSTSVSGAPGTRSKVTIRGENNLSGNSEPLWIVDGLPMMSGVPKNNTGDYAGTIMQDGIGNILPEDIESITILKDASAAAIYGAKAANGVIVVTTKKGFRSKTVISYSGNFSISEAPKMKIDFMNSSEKLQYENSLMQHYGLNNSHLAGRGGALFKEMMTGTLTPNDYQNQINTLSQNNTNWFDEIFRTAFSHSHSISLRGGSEEMTYYTSVNYQEKTGILSSNRYSNAGILIKMDYRPISNFIVGIDLTANARKNRDHASAIDPFNYAVFANPYEKAYDDNGIYASDLTYLSKNYSDNTASGYKFNNFNILRELDETSQKNEALDVALTLNLRYDIVKGLALSSVIRKGISYSTETTALEAGTYSSYIQEKFAKQVFNVANVTPGQEVVLPSQYNNGEFSESAGKNNNWSIRNQLDYSFTIKNDHLFSVLIANEITSKKYNNFGYTSPVYYGDYRITGIPDFTGVDYMKLRDQIKGLFHTTTGQDRTVSFLGSMRYGYNDKYIVNFNIRADGADAMGDGNRFTPLWSIGGRYNIHKEGFLKSNFINELSVRGSFGYTGNIDRSAYPFSTISLGDQLYEGDRVVDQFYYPNPPVGWERKLDRNIGIDLSLLKQRIQFTADYYNNKTKDILEYVSIPISTGRPDIKTNGGVVANEGVELYLNLRWLNSRNITFSTSVNVARNRNKIIKSRYHYDNYLEATKHSNIRGGVVNIVGKETGSIYGWKSAGVDPASGNPRYYLTTAGKKEYGKIIDGWNGYSKAVQEAYQKSGMIPSLTTTPDYIAYDRMPIDDPYFLMKETPAVLMASMQHLGTTTPKFVGGFNTYLRWKNLEFTTQWSFKAGHLIESFNDLQNAPNNSAGFASDLGVSSTNRERKYLSYWQSPGDKTNIARFVPEGKIDYWSVLHTSDKYEKGNYLRLSNLSVSYRLPSYLIKLWDMNNVAISFNAYNLCTFTKYKGLDVGTAGAFSYPVSREYNLKLSFGF